MPSDNEDARPGRRSETGVKQAGQPGASVTGWYDLPRGRAYAGPPCGGRGLWLAIVMTCPQCGGMHSHRVGETARLLAGRIIKRCPVAGQPYVLAPVQRRREARRA